MAEPGVAALVSYRSAGRCAIVAEADFGLSLAAQLPALACTVIVPVARSIPRLQLGENGERVLEARLTACEGHLGAFSLRVADAAGERSAARAAGLDSEYFDLLIDTGERPLITRRVPPPGYYAPRDEAALAAALAEANGLVGEFEKPVYSAVDAARCAHGANGVIACRRCLDACAAGAISSRGEQVVIDPLACLGCGDCALLCPSGAVRYRHPGAVSVIDSVRAALSGERRTVLFHREAEGVLVESWLGDCGPAVLPVALEEVAWLGIEVWLSLLAGGCARVWLLLPDRDAPEAQAMAEQLVLAEALLGGLGIGAGRLRLFGLAQGDRPPTGAAPEPLCPLSRARLFDDKRQLVRRALDQLRGERPAAAVALPAGAPFGEIVVDADRCTLCMACSSACPVGALQAGGDEPALRFLEDACVQCGLCRSTCPEGAIGRRPRYVYDSASARRPRTLHREEPFRCLRCAKPFATRSGIETVTARLAEHPMFQDPAALRRLQLCEDCRVVDMMESGSDLLAR